MPAGTYLNIINYSTLKIKIICIRFFTFSSKLVTQLHPNKNKYCFCIFFNTIHVPIVPTILFSLEIKNRNNTHIINNK